MERAHEDALQTSPPSKKQKALHYTCECLCGSHLCVANPSNHHLFNYHQTMKMCKVNMLFLPHFLVPPSVNSSSNLHIQICVLPAFPPFYTFIACSDSVFDWPLKSNFQDWWSTSHPVGCLQIFFCWVFQALVSLVISLMQVHAIGHICLWEFFKFILLSIISMIHSSIFN